MFSLVVGGFATPCHRIGECHDRFASNEKGVLFIRSVGGPDTSVRGLAACERAWWLEARGFGGVEGVVLRANDEPAGTRTRPGAGSPVPPYDVPPKVETFFNCVAGSILMTWCELAGRAGTS